MNAGIDYQMVETLAVVIGCSQIVMARPRTPMPNLPGGFDSVDVAVLDWIAAEAEVVSRRLLQM
jgi:hypothetical protein